jgi:radical SAM protein with 4Fe4S-binding SPASM domain
MKLFVRKKTELNYIIFEVTPRCNLNCLYCYNHWKRPGETTPEELDYKSTKKTLAKLFKTTTLNHVTFSGGEPLLFERIEELILFCRMKGATVSVITNGNSGNINLFSSLIRIGVNLFELPVHAHQSSIHDRMTQRLGSWEQSLRTLHTLQKLGGYVVPVIVITRYNYQTVGETLRYLHGLGINRVMLNRYNIGGISMQHPERILSTHAELRMAFKQANQVARELHMSVTSNVCTPHCVIEPKEFPTIGFTNCSAEISKRPLTVTAYGDIRFCNHSPSVLGNVHKQPIQQILHDAACTFGEFEKPEFCAECTVYDKCLGGCRAAAEQVSGTLKAVDPLVFHLLKPFKEHMA